MSYLLIGKYALPSHTQSGTFLNIGFVVEWGCSIHSFPASEYQHLDIVQWKFSLFFCL